MLYILGPGLRTDPHILARKVIAAGGTQKNWRLNGEFVPDPPDDPERYWELTAGDFAIFGFEEQNALPSGIVMVLVSQNELSDASVFARVTEWIGGRHACARTHKGS